MINIDTNSQYVYEAHDRHSRTAKIRIMIKAAEIVFRFQKPSSLYFLLLFRITQSHFITN